MSRRAILSAGRWTLAAALLLRAGSADALQLFTATLDGASERPTPVATTATGSGSVVLDESGVNPTISILLSWTGMTSNALFAHIHGPAGPNATANPVIDFLLFLPPIPSSTGSLVGQPLQVTLTPAQAADLKAGLWYFNVHSTNFPNGEIRGQILVPEPAAGLLWAVGLAGVLATRRRA